MLAFLTLFVAMALGFASGFVRWSFLWAVAVSLVSGWFFAAGGHGIDLSVHAIPPLMVAFADSLPVMALSFGARLLGRFVRWVNG